MLAFKFLVATTLCLTVTLAQAAGFRFIEVPPTPTARPSREPCGIPAPNPLAKSSSAHSP
jgi:hypothetical protein